MPKLSRFQVMNHVKPLILKEFQNYGKGTVFALSDIKKMFIANKEKWTLPKVTRVKDFIKFLIDKDILQVITEHISENYSIKKYLYGDAHRYKTALSLRKNSYLSHYTAVYIHSLTDNVPKNIYTNQEQSYKYSYNSELSQKNIDFAFSRPMRRTNHIVTFNQFKVYLINGKYTNKLGVINHNAEHGQVEVTNLERTLLDITIRPGYSGGINEVLNAYVAAKDKLSVNKLIAYLKKLKYTYPYHQAIGFYLEQAGYKESQLKLVENIEMKYEFYITYGIKDKAYSKRWKLFYPKNFN